MPEATSGYVAGFMEAERQFYAIEADRPYRENPQEYRNPFAEGSDEYRGFEDGVYTFTQK